MTNINTPSTNWKNAISDIRAAGIKFRSNLPVCCGSCTTYDDLKLTDKNIGYAFFFGTQGRGFSFDRTTGEALDKRGDKVEAIYIDYGSYGENTDDEATTKIGEIIINAFKNNGVPTSWDGSPFTKLAVSPNGTPIED